jgi:esterase FrsA
VNDLAELKKFVIAHAQALAMPSYAEVLGRIDNDDSGPGSWVAEWSRAGQELEDAGQLLEACQRYNMARFPFVDGPARQEALERCVGAFDRWRQAVPVIQPLEVSLPGGTVRCWSSGLSADAPKPLLVIMGGIVSIKEQWAPVLLGLGGLGVAGVVAEMPGVGENPLPYDRDSWQFLPALLDAVADRADVSRTYLLALSFSGHMAIRAALADRRIAGIVGAGAPIHDFFTDVSWPVPKITVDTLAHLTGAKSALDAMRDWAVTDAELSALDIPLRHITSLRDEIIPPGDGQRLRLVRDVEVLEHDDVHGSPDHFTETRMWAMLSLYRMLDVHNEERAGLAKLFGQSG